MNSKVLRTATGVTALVLALMSVSCEKRTQFNEEDAQAAVDVRVATAQMDEVIVDINALVGDQFLLRGRTSSASAALSTSICGLRADTGAVYTGSAVMTYTGGNCNGKRKTGTVKLSLLNYPASKWKHKGSILRIEFLDYKVTSTTTNKSASFSGVAFLTNETGGTWYELYYLGMPGVTYRLNAEDLHVKFDDGELAIYSMGRRMKFALNGKILHCGVESCGIYGGGDADCWGQTRTGKGMHSNITSGIRWNSLCGADAPTYGEFVVRDESRVYNLNCILSVDEQGNENGTDQVCPFGWKVFWSYKGSVKQRILEN